MLGSWLCIIYFACMTSVLSISIQESAVCPSVSNEPCSSRSMVTNDITVEKFVTTVTMDLAEMVALSDFILSVVCLWSRFMAVSSYCSPNTPV